MKNTRRKTLVTWALVVALVEAVLRPLLGAFVEDRLCAGCQFGHAADSSLDPPMGAVASGTRRVAWQAGPREGIPGVW